MPRLVLWSTALLLVAGVGAFQAWWYTGNPFWIRAYFYYPGALFFLGCSSLGGWFAYRCWCEFAPGDLLRPAWFLITLSAVCQVAGGLASQVFSHQSHLNPLFYLPVGQREAAVSLALDLGRIFGPLYMVFLGWGLLYVVRTCRGHGVLGRLHVVDYLQLAVVVLFTTYSLSSIASSVVTSQNWPSIATVIGWTSDPLLCVLLFEAILIRRSTANMGWGLISRCWLAFTVAVFLTSVGDIGLWMAGKHALPYALEVSSWYVWFIASAAYALGPVYQLQAIRCATSSYGETTPATLDDRRETCAI